jgi:Holliday junction resolvasome RuvABC DNA-binding subunit
MIWTPYQISQAGMIGTDQAASAASQADRNTVLSFVNRADVASRLQSMGVDQKTAQERIASLSDQEVQSLASQINSAPAGAMADAWAVVIVILIVIGVWYLWKRM